jgi:pimeloyl-ACP methyl ester carboxylesterase
MMNASSGCEDRYVQVDAIRTRYWRAGDRGSPVVLVHGFGSYIEVWATLFEFLARTHQVYALDLVGFGRTDKPPGAYSYPFFADFLLHFVQTLGIDRATYIGWSFGGGIVLRLAVDHPDRPEKLVLIASGGLSRRLALSLRLLTVPVLGEILATPSRRGSYNGIAFMVYDPGIIQREWVDLDYTMTVIPGVKRTMLRTIRTGANLRGEKPKWIRPIVDRLPTIEVPTLILWGRQDPVVPFRNAAIAAERIPRARLVPIDRCGHAPPLEHPDLVREQVQHFLDD